MMEKNKFLLLMIMLVSFLFIGRVSAADTCSTADLSMLNTEAANIKATYVPNRILEGDGNDASGEAGGNVINVLDLKVYNMTDKFILKYKFSGKGIKDGEFYRNISNVGQDGAITVRQRNYGTVINYVITVISSYGNCSGREIRSIRVTLPMYNYYSNMDVCRGVQDYYLCQPYVTTEIDSISFYDKVEQYKAKLLDNSDIEIEDDNNSVVSSALTGVKKHKYLIVGIIVAVGVAATIVILKRKKSEA